MKTPCLAAPAQSSLVSAAAASEGLVDLKSPRGAKATTDRLEDPVQQRGLDVFAPIDHAAGAAQVGKTLPPTAMLSFGNPQGSPPFMACARSVGIDLPLRALIRKDAAAQSQAGSATTTRPG
jgi:uncharacterized protein (DUF302 family)